MQISGKWAREIVSSWWPFMRSRGRRDSVKLRNFLWRLFINSMWLRCWMRANFSMSSGGSSTFVNTNWNREKVPVIYFKKSQSFSTIVFTLVTSGDMFIAVQMSMESISTTDDIRVVRPSFSALKLFSELSLLPAMLNFFPFSALNPWEIK